MAYEHLVMTHGYGSWYGDSRIESWNLFSSFNNMNLSLVGMDDP